jgi:hypothetical protein
MSFDNAENRRRHFIFCSIIEFYFGDLYVNSIINRLLKSQKIRLALYVPYSSRLEFFTFGLSHTYN